MGFDVDAVTAGKESSAHASFSIEAPGETGKERVGCCGLQ